VGYSAINYPQDAQTDYINVGISNWEFS